MAGASPAKKGSGSSTGAAPLDVDLELLDAQFDELIGNPDSATAVKAEVVKEEVKSEANPTPTKRRRTGRLSAGSSSQSLSHGVADVVAKDDEHGGSTAAPAAGDTAHGEDKHCIGCARKYGVSPCHIRPAETVQWSLPNGRGGWCKDCHAVWRTVFQGRGYLGDLEDWLKQDPVKRAEFHLCRLAYLSLVFEGNLACIHREHVLARLHMLKWMSHVCCLCLESHVVVPFEEAAVENSPWRRFAALPSNLTTIHSSGAHRLGVCVPTQMTTGALGVMDRPVAQAGDLPFLHQKCLLMSTTPGDTPLLSELFGEGAASSSLASATPAVEEGVEAPCKGDGFKTRLEKRLNALCYGCRELLDSFTTSTWTRTNGSSFTKPANQVSALLMESKQLAESEATLDAATAWSHGLTSGKTFMRLHRLFEKSNHKPERLLEMLDPPEGLQPVLDPDH